MGTHRARIAALLVAAAFAGCGGDEEPAQPDLPAAPNTVSFSSPVFKDGGAIPVEFTCDGAGKPPTLSWRGLPQDTIELVLIVEDPDAPDGTFTHWTKYGIGTTSAGGLATDGQFPAGSKDGRNSAGKDGWTPPCPPEGDEAHRYVFALYALTQGTSLEPGADVAAVKQAVEGAPARGVFTGTYKR